MRTGLRLLVGIMVGLALTACSENADLDQHGRKVAAERLEDQWLIINYWADWCAPCRREIPQLNQLAEQLSSQGVQVFGVNFDGLQDAALEKASDAMGIGFTVLAKDPAARFGLPRSEVLPVTYIIDGHGELRAALPGEQTAAGLRERLAALGKED